MDDGLDANFSKVWKFYASYLQCIMPPTKVKTSAFLIYTIRAIYLLSVYNKQIIDIFLPYL